MSTNLNEPLNNFGKATVMAEKDFLDDVWE
jgi:hypothetical protein